MSSKRLRHAQMRKAVARSKGNLKAEREACRDLVELLSRDGRAEEEWRECKDMAEVCNKMGDKKEEAMAHRRVVDLGVQLEKWEGSLRSAEEYVRLSSELHDSAEYQRSLVTKGRLFYHHALAMADAGRDKEAERKLREAEELYVKAEEAIDLVGGEVRPAEAAAMRAGCGYNLFQIQRERKAGREALFGMLRRLARVVSEHRLPVWNYKICVEMAELSAQDELEEAEDYLKDAGKFLRGMSKEETADLDQSQYFLLKARILLRKRSFKEARDLLRHASSSDKSLMDDVTFANTFRGIGKLFRAASRLENISEGGAGRQKLLERLGDVASSLGLSEIAARYYSDSLDSPEGRSLTDRNRAALFYSVATCEYEAGRFPEALAAFRSELAFSLNSDEPEAAIETWAKVVFSLKRMGQPFRALEKELREALSFARKKRLFAEEAKLLNLLAELQKENLLHREAQDSLRAASEIVSEHSVSGDQLSPYGDVVPDRYEFSSESENESGRSRAEEDDEEAELSKRNRRRGAKLKTNQKGETELHLKCQKEGNEAAIRRILASGTVPVDMRDKFGFTPLLEACSYGHLEYVRILHEAGADLNWVGGQEDRVSALIDACSGGHLELAEYLLENGARVFHQDKDGWLAVDHLRHYLRENGADMRESDVAKGKQLVGRMKKALESRERSGQAVYVIPKKSVSSALAPSGDDPKEQVTIEDDLGPGFSRRRQAGEHAPASTIRGSEESFKRRRRPQGKSPLPRGAAEYRDVMAALKSKRGVQEMSQEDGGRKSQPEEEKTDEEVDDIFFSRPAKIKRTGSKKREIRVEGKAGGADLEEELPDISGSPVMARLDEDVEYSPEIVPTKEISDLDHEKFVRKTEGEAPSSGAAAVPTPAYNPPNLVSDKACFVVSVRGKRLLVPLDTTKDNTVSHLAEIAARRFSAGGAIPKLTLMTTDGAELHGDDPAAIVLSGSKEVVGKINGWHVPPPAERYASACKSSKNPRLKEVEEKLQQCERTKTLAISFALGPERAEPVFRAISHLSCVRELDLSANKLQDKGVEALSTVLPTLPELRLLNLSTNGLTGKSVAYLLRATEHEDPVCLRQLKTLNLSFNDLGDQGVEDIPVLVKALNLEYLALTSCGLSTKSKDLVETCKAQIQNVNYKFNSLSL